MLNRLTMGKQKQVSPSGGFTLIEVLAGIIVATAFVLITSQAIAISALYRVRAQRESLAWLWIQENFEEDVKFEVSQLAYNASQCDATTTAGGYAQALINAVNTVPVETNPKFLNKAHNATRTLGVKADAPYNVMTVSYEVRDPDIGTASNSNANLIASFYTEVIPDAAFNCD